MQKKTPTISDIYDAAACLRGVSIRTPLIEHPVLNDVAGGRVLLKAENMQRVGAFKFRGAYNAILHIDKNRYPGGIVACSSGNHAQGVALAAKLCGVSAVVVMPEDAPELKRARTIEFGAEVVTYNRVCEDRTAIATTIAKERDSAFVHPFDDFHIIAGQGTVGLELMQQAAEINAVPTRVLVCCAGGGLLSGIALAVKYAAPQTQVHPVEPAGFDDFARSLVAGQRCVNTLKSGSICDALLVDQPGEMTFEIARDMCGAGLSVTDDEVCDAMRFAFRELKLVVEPGGAAALAAVLGQKLTTHGQITACTISGGNVDSEQFYKIVK